ncbi:hypothetical protein LPB142_17615 (plasmid) [Rhodobacter xanthinilyticus]|uniref:Uncharacterized protein n=1 Tax=Rhodobacter xanthinilyticus TaxID=1850250 RepID=A0A1D9MHH0_9RHOB|nr:hypothetical protein LPB142_17615 [Rhodobacter xanthinilyticus]
MLQAAVSGGRGGLARGHGVMAAPHLMGAIDALGMVRAGRCHDGRGQDKTRQKDGEQGKPKQGENSAHGSTFACRPALVR